MDRRPPQTGLPLVDNLLALAWTFFAVLNFTITPSGFANIAVGLGALVTTLLTILRIYQHLAGETVVDTIINDPDG